MAQQTYDTFTRNEAIDLWSRLVAGWADHLNPTGTRLYADGLPNTADAGGSYEGVTRMLWGLGSWLADPQRPAELTWRGQRYDLEALTRTALVNGCDPTQRGSWYDVAAKNPEQRTVESAQVAFVLWQTRDRIWAHLGETERANVVAFLTAFGERPTAWGSNWALFWLLNHTGRKALGAPYDQTVLDDVLFDYLDRVYAGDGWYDDAAERGANRFDNYLSWVFATHVMAWAAMDGAALPERRDTLLSRVRQWMQVYPYFFAADGATVEYGRSLSYKFARLGAPLWAYRLGVWPHRVGLLKRLVGQHLRWYVNRGAVRADGTLRQTLTASGSSDIIEPYTSTGAPYWAMLAFSGLWSLPDDDPFWNAEEEPLPAARDSFRAYLTRPGWLLNVRDGHVELFNGGTARPGYGNKYGKLVYSTRTPFNVGLDAGQPSLDGGLYLSENGQRAQRTQVLAHALDQAGWLRTLYPIDVNGHRHLVDTTIVLVGNVHLRAHQVTLDPAAGMVLAEEGSSALGYNAGEIPAQATQGRWLFAAASDVVIGLSPVLGYRATTARLVDGSANSVYGHNRVGVVNATLASAARLQAAGTNGPELVTMLPPTRSTGKHELACAFYAGGSPDRASLPTFEQPHWTADGHFRVRIGGQDISVPPLSR